MRYLLLLTLLLSITPPLSAREVDAQASRALPQTQAGGYVVLGVHSTTAPLEWRNNGMDQGFNIELMERIGQLIGKKIIVRRKSFQQLLDDVHDPISDIDVIAVVSPVNVGRQLSQSDPIYATHANAYTLHGHALITSWADLKDKRIAIKRSSFVDVYLSGYPQPFQRVDVDLYETGFQLLFDQQVDVVIAESFVARRLLPLYPYVRSSSDALIYGAFNFVANPGKAQLMRQINDALRQLKLSGEYDVLVNKWFGTGREKVDQTSTEHKVFNIAIITALISILGMLYTGYISLRLRRRTQALAQELAHRHRVEAEISELSTQFQSVLDGIPHGVTILNKQQQRLWSNDNNIHLLTSDELHYLDGQKFSLQAALEKVLFAQQSLSAELGYRQQFWHLQIHPIAREQVVVLLEESTEQHRLRQANEESSRLASLGELSAGIAHEINNPTGLIIHAAALFSSALNDLEQASHHYQKQNPFWQIAGLEPDLAMAELHQSRQSIAEAAQRISRIVHDLKRYATPHTQDEQTRVALNEVVQVALRLTANQTKLHQVRLELTEPSPVVYGDPPQLQQVMINLIQNACHACQGDVGQIEIETLTTQTQAILRISDNGIGMDSATLKRATEPFFTTRRREGGTGLGLSVSSRIVKQHNGQMQLQSSPGKGSSISLIFDKAEE